MGRHRLRQLLVPAADVVALVGGAEDAEVAGPGLVAEQVDQVERALVGGLGPVLDVVGHVEEHAEGRGVAARHPRFDPVVDAHRVERAAARGAQVEERRVAGVLDVAVERLVHRLEVAVRLRLRVVLAKEVIGVLRAVGHRPEQVVEREVEAFGQRLDGLVTAVDQLAAPLAHLAVAPVATHVREHAAADATGGLVDGGVDAGVLEGERRAQAGDAGTDDGDARGGGAARETGDGEARHRCRRAGQELAPGDRALRGLPAGGALVADGLHVDAGGAGELVITRELQQ